MQRALQELYWNIADTKLRQYTILSLLLIVGHSLALGLSPAHATTIASYTPTILTGTTGIVGPSCCAAQTFVAKKTAHVGLVSVLLRQNGFQESSTIGIDLRETVSGLPSTAVLGTRQIVIPQLSIIPTFFSIDFGPLGIELQTGKSYAIVLGNLKGSGFRWVGTGANEDGFQINPFLDGQGFFSPDDGVSWPSPVQFDHGFIVNAVPEPSTILLMGSGLLGLTFWRWKRNRRNYIFLS